jgi:hypothetical protein
MPSHAITCNPLQSALHLSAIMLHDGKDCMRARVCNVDDIVAIHRHP